MFLTNIQAANIMEDLLKIFDKYIVPRENNDAIQIYGQSDNARNRMESLLISFLGHLKKNNSYTNHLLFVFSLLTAITFIVKYYQEDNEFTDKSSRDNDGLINRLDERIIEIDNSLTFDD